MQRITDESTPHQLPFEAYGAEVRLCANTPELLARAEPLMPPGWRPCPSTDKQLRVGILEEDDGTYSVFTDKARVSDSQTLELSLIMLEGQLRGHVAYQSDKTFVHAGVVGHEGRAILFPGHSFAGKTTVVAALVRAGAVYLSDEFAVLDQEGLVHPYPKPLSLRDDPAKGQVETPVEQLGGVAAEGPLPVGLAVFTYFQPGATWRPERLSPGRAVLTMVSHTVSIRSRPDTAMHALTRALDGATGLEGPRGEAEELADQLLAGAPV